MPATIFDENTCYAPPPEAFLYCNWQNLLFQFITVITIPLYIAILSTIIFHRSTGKALFEGVFYSLILSQGISDVLALISLFIGSIFTTFHIALDLLVKYKFIVGNVSTDITYYFAANRSFGDLLFSIQRLLVFRFSHTRINKKVLAISTLKVFIFHWSIPLLLSIPTFVTPSLKAVRRYDDPNGELLTALWPEQEYYEMVLSIWVIFMFIAIVTIDVYIVYYVWNEIKKSGIRSHHELRLLLILICQAIALSCMSAYFTLRLANIIDIQYEIPVLWIGQFWPFWQHAFSLINGIESFVNPWVYFFLNRHLRDEVLRFLKIKKNVVDVSMTISLY